MERKTRLFIAVELPDEVRKNIIELINELKSSGAAVKWVAEENLHITLKFLGWVEDRKIDGVIELTAKAVSGSGGFKASFEGLGTFPPGKSPRVVWVGVKEGDEELKKLAVSLGEKSFNSHVTIGRIKDKKGVDVLKEKMSGFKEVKFGEVRVGSVGIMKSTLTPKGPIYEKIKEVKL